MARSVKEWRSENPDQAIPARVKVRVFDRAKSRCQICQRKLGPSDEWQADHIIALVNGGEHAEANLQVACSWCHRVKTNEDVAEKSKVATIRKKHIGAKQTGQNWPRRTRINPDTGRKERHTGFRWREI